MTFIPWRAIDRYHHYGGMSADVRSLAQIHAVDRSLVLIDGPQDPDFASAVTYNPIDLNAPLPIYAWNLNRDEHVKAEILRNYYGRPVWEVNGPSVTGAGFDVARGPLAAVDLLSEQRSESREHRFSAAKT